MSFRTKQILEELQVKVINTEILYSTEDSEEQKKAEEFMSSLGEEYSLFRTDVCECNVSLDARCIPTKFYISDDYKTLIMHTKAVIDIKRTISSLTIIRYSLEDL